MIKDRKRRELRQILWVLALGTPISALLFRWMGKESNELISGAMALIAGVFLLFIAPYAAREAAYIYRGIWGSRADRLYPFPETPEYGRHENVAFAIMLVIGCAMAFAATRL